MGDFSWVQKEYKDYDEIEFDMSELLILDLEDLTREYFEAIIDPEISFDKVKLLRHIGEFNQAAKKLESDVTKIFVQVCNTLRNCENLEKFRSDSRTPIDMWSYRRDDE